MSLPLMGGCIDGSVIGVMGAILLLSLYHNCSPLIRFIVGMHKTPGPSDSSQTGSHFQPGQTAAQPHASKYEQDWHLWQ
jgi:hypothetical protein